MRGFVEGRGRQPRRKDGSHDPEQGLANHAARIASSERNATCRSIDVRISSAKTTRLFAPCHFNRNRRLERTVFSLHPWLEKMATNVEGARLCRITSVMRDCNRRVTADLDYRFKYLIVNRMFYS